VSDAVDRVLTQWHAERPDLDVSAMGVIGRLSRASALLDRQIGRILADYGLQPGEFDLLATLRRSGAPYQLTVGQLLKSTMVTSGAVTHRLNRLDDKGLVTRDLDPSNRRSVLVALTTKGLHLVDQALPAHVANEQHLLACLTSQKQEALAGLLRELLLGLGDPASD
jgi:DNA-binding MarR family transcriptional regulator